MHDFRERLEYSDRMSDEPFWDAVYRKAFPNLVNHMQCKGDFDSQRLGVDRLLFLGNNHVLRVDEKKRSEVWPDILLEYLSVDTAGKPGWIELDKAIDYIAYAFMPSRKVYLLPWPLLRRAWLENGERWKQKARDREDGFCIIPAKNPGYTTHSVAVPINTLYCAINRASIIEVHLDEGQSPGRARDETTGKYLTQ